MNVSVPSVRLRVYRETSWYGTCMETDVGNGVLLAANIACDIGHKAGLMPYLRRVVDGGGGSRRGRVRVWDLRLPAL